MSSIDRSAAGIQPASPTAADSLALLLRETAREAFLEGAGVDVAGEIPDEISAHFTRWWIERLAAGRKRALEQLGEAEREPPA